MTHLKGASAAGGGWGADRRRQFRGGVRRARLKIPQQVGKAREAGSSVHQADYTMVQPGRRCADNGNTPKRLWHLQQSYVSATTPRSQYRLGTIEKGCLLGTTSESY